MGLFGSLARGYLAHRLTRGSRGSYGHRPGGYPRSGYPGHGYPTRGYEGYEGYRQPAHPRRGRDGFRFVGPFPAYSRRTRRGARVSVGGCCLPIPLLVLGATTTAATVGTRRALRPR